jgi:hypothetical protein
VAGRIASRIFLVGATLPQFADEIGVMVIFVLCVVLGPLLVFGPQLAAAKQVGLREYGTLEESYVRESSMLSGCAEVRPPMRLSSAAPTFNQWPI